MRGKQKTRNCIFAHGELRRLWFAAVALYADSLELRAFGFMFKKREEEYFKRVHDVAFQTAVRFPATHNMEDHEAVLSSAYNCSSSGGLPMSTANS